MSSFWYTALSEYAHHDIINILYCITCYTRRRLCGNSGGGGGGGGNKRTHSDAAAVRFSTLVFVHIIYMYIMNSGYTPTHPYPTVHTRIVPTCHSHGQSIFSREKKHLSHSLSHIQADRMCTLTCTSTYLRLTESLLVSPARRVPPLPPSPLIIHLRTHNRLKRTRRRTLFRFNCLCVCMCMCV